jgi:hypothetical protein
MCRGFQNARIGGTGIARLDTMTTLKMWSTGGYRCEILRDEPMYLVRLLGEGDEVLLEQVTYSTDAASTVVLEWASEVIGIDAPASDQTMIEGIPPSALSVGRSA